VVLLDIMLGDETGLDVLKELRGQHKQIPVIMITGFGSIDSAVQSIKLGAYDYVTKPLDFEKLLKIVENALKLSVFPLDQRQAPDNGNHVAPRLINHNPMMRALYEQATRFAGTDFPVLICGENGTGKEVIADFIHTHSTRNTAKMLKINCAAFPETLLDNELFGHEKGAYTGAETMFKGVFERAHQSSLFLDEIGDMPLTIQSKILRVLQNHEIRRIGGDRTITVDVRFIAATNKDLRKLISAQAFREDLFYRLDVAVLDLPPLRERKEDIPLLAEYFLTEYAQNHPVIAKEISGEVLAILAQHHWPGNVRELRNTIHYAAAISRTPVLEAGDLPPRYKSLIEPEAPNIRENMERKLILDILQQTNHNKKKAAELLNMSRNTLYHKMEKYGIPI
jgi:DNA-binding NtrC family response regulator